MLFERVRLMAVPAFGLLAASYLVMLIGVSLASEERVLGLNQPKRFCGAYLDCHRIVSVVGLERHGTLGSERADGIFYIVTLRFTSDAVVATTHSGIVTATVRDDDGRRYRRATHAEGMLDPEGGSVGIADTPLRPGESHATRIVFDVPADARNLRLLVTDGHWIARLTELFLIGDEDSFLHAKTTFALNATWTGRTAGPVERSICDLGGPCDLSAAVVSVEIDTAGGRRPNRVPADGVFYVVTVRYRSLSPEPITATPRIVASVRARSGVRYHRALDVEAMLDSPDAGDSELLQRYVFDLPDDITAPVLLIRKPGLLNRLRGGAAFQLPAGPGA